MSKILHDTAAEYDRQIKQLDTRIKSSTQKRDELTKARELVGQVLPQASTETETEQAPKAGAPAAKKTPATPAG
ncbi:MAG: hypothetical protein H0X34_17820 [Chthoniobacterales bacterium]|nr:hypothetical protein [Chthoniobacterales bacterium]